MTFPDYVILGGQRCGTTSMMHYIADHPGVGNVPRKEVQFFNWHFGRGLGWYGRRVGRRKPGLLYGEKSPGYLPDPRVPERIAQIVPNAKFIVLLRNPVDRAWSQYWLKRHLRRERMPFHKAVWSAPTKLFRDAWGASVSDYLLRGHYAEQLRRWFEQYPREQFLIIRSEDFYRNTAGAMAQVWDFLDLPRRHGRYERKAHLTKGQMGAETRRKLAAYFKPHNQELYELLGRNFKWEG